MQIWIDCISGAKLLLELTSNPINFVSWISMCFAEFKEQDVYYVVLLSSVTPWIYLFVSITSPS